jgi:F420-non-reducing hydrogenase iron-sulfur subunit
MSAKIKGFCCNYTASVSVDALKEAGLVPEDFEMERLPCSGRLEVPQLLEAFEQGADAVFVAGCMIDECHNLSGSRRASKRVGQAKKIIQELGMDQSLVEMFFVGRGETGPVVEAVREMISRAEQAE